MFLSIVLLIVGCAPENVDPAEDRCYPGYEPGPLGCVFSEDATADTIRHMDDGRLVKINAVPFLQEMGPSLNRNVWVSPVPVPDWFDPNTGMQLDAADLYMLVDPSSNDVLPAEFPIGTLIIHETIDREQGHTVQVKVGGATFLDENGRDWWFGKYFDDGLPDENDCTPCTTCHNDGVRPESDGIMGVPRSAL